MDKNKLNISSIESFFYDLLFEKVSSNVFMTTLPPVINDEWKEMAVIAIPSSISNKDAFGRGTVSIQLYAQPLSDGSKNLSTFSKMEKALNESVEQSSNPTYSVSLLGNFSEYDTDAKMHCNIYLLQLLIV